MKKQRFSLLLLLTITLGRPNSHAQNALSTAHSLQDAFAQVAERTKGAVVNISAIHEQEIRVISPFFFFGDPDDRQSQPFSGPGSRTYRQRLEGVGSGFIIDEEGHVITNDHVVKDATEIRVTLTLQGREQTLTGKVIGRDPNLDLAVVQIKAKRSFPFLRLGNSDKVRVGDWALAIGSPFSLQQTVTAGIISAMRQTLYIEGRPYMNLLQTDAAINRGNSGGPLINLDGEVIGVNTAIFSPSGAFAGIGFAIPANEVRLALEYLLAGKQRRRGWLGVEVSPIDEILRRKFGLPEVSGALVNSIVPKSPAQSAGLRRGDVIVKLEAQEVRNPQDLVARISRFAPGNRISLEIYRNGSPKTLTAILGQKPEAGEIPGARRPTRQEDLGPSAFAWEGAHFALSPDGVRAVRVDAGSPFHGTLMEGDILRGVDDSAINNLQDLQEVSRRVNLSQGVVLDILRRGRPMYLSLRTG